MKRQGQIGNGPQMSTSDPQRVSCKPTASPSMFMIKKRKYSLLLSCLKLKEFFNAPEGGGLSSTSQFPQPGGKYDCERMEVL